jgi:hypothetical protein
MVLMQNHERRTKGMPIFMMFGKYSTEALKGISSERTKQAVDAAWGRATASDRNKGLFLK